MIPKVIPKWIVEGIDLYVNERTHPGGLLCAALSNDLCLAVATADAECPAALREIIWYVWERVPMVAWGSRQRVAEWLRGDGGLHYIGHSDGAET